MSLLSEERDTVRSLCGYPPDDQVAAFQNWRFYQARGLLEFRCKYLTSPEVVVVRRYIATIGDLQAAIERSDDVAETGRVLRDWRRRLCGFLGVPEGPELAEEARRLVP